MRGLKPRVHVRERFKEFMELGYEKWLRPTVARERLNRLEPALARHLAGMGSPAARAQRRNRLMESLDLPCRSLEAYFWARFHRHADGYLTGEVVAELIIKLLDGTSGYRSSKGRLGPWLSGAIRCDVLDLLAREKTRIDHRERLARHAAQVRGRGWNSAQVNLDQEDLLACVARVIRSVRDPVEAAIGREILRSLRETGDLPVQAVLAEELGVSDPVISRGKQALFAKLRGPLADRAVVLGGGFTASGHVDVLKV